MDDSVYIGAPLLVADSNDEDKPPFWDRRDDSLTTEELLAS